MSVNNTSINQLINIDQVPVEIKRLTRQYLRTILDNTACTAHYQVVANRHLPISIILNRANPPSATITENLLDRLYGLQTIQLLNYQESNIHVVASEGITCIPIIHVTQVNLALLHEALAQEKRLSTEPAETDMQAWIALPAIIQRYWGQFNTQLRVHIMDCMMQSLDNQTDCNKTRDLHCTLFSAPTSRTALSIPVCHPEEGRACELIELLTALPSQQFKLLMPMQASTIPASTMVVGLNPRTLLS